MPLYEFKCQSCGKKMEKLCRVGEDGSSFRCRACQGTVKKALSLFRSPGTGGPDNCSTCTSTSCSTCS